MAPRGCSSQQSSPSCHPTPTPGTSLCPVATRPQWQKGRTSASLLWAMALPRGPVVGAPHFWAGRLKSQMWIDFYPLVAGMGRDRGCTPARLVGDWDGTRRCKGEQAKLGLALDSAEKRQAATLGCPLGQEAPRSGPLEAVLRKEETGRWKEQVKENKNHRGFEQVNC